MLNVAVVEVTAAHRRAVVHPTPAALAAAHPSQVLPHAATATRHRAVAAALTARLLPRAAAATRHQAEAAAALTARLLLRAAATRRATAALTARLRRRAATTPLIRTRVRVATAIPRRAATARMVRHLAAKPLLAGATARVAVRQPTALRAAPIEGPTRPREVVATSQNLAQRPPATVVRLCRRTRRLAETEALWHRLLPKTKDHRLRLPAHAALPIPVMQRLAGMVAQCRRPQDLYDRPLTSIIRIITA